MTLPAFFAREGRELMLEGVALNEIVARFGSPTYVYSRAAITAAFAAYRDGLGNYPGLICYAVKANSNLAVLDCLARLGAGFDIVSGGELQRVLRAGGLAKRVIFSGVGKTDAEIEAALGANIRCFNIESEAEIEKIAAAARRLGVVAPVSLRINPDVDPLTHPYIATGMKESKFGIAHADAIALYRKAKAFEELEVVGIDCHIGSQMLDEEPLIESLDRLLDLVDSLAAEGIALSHIDLGGGLGVRYRDEQSVAISEFVATVTKRIARWQALRRDTSAIELLLEPGRSIVANAGVLLTQVEYLKCGSKNFAVVDAAMNDLLRPALYDAWHDIVPLGAPGHGAQKRVWDVVGPVCESGDWLAHDRELEIAPGDALGILSAGAYAMVMASNYNSRGRAAEVMVDGGNCYLVRARETIDDLLLGEARLPM